MFFTRIGTIVAWLLFVVAGFRAGMAFYISVFVADPKEAEVWAARYLTASDPDRSFSQALPVLGFAVAVGILAEISRAVRR
jgi:hypothetical protein